MDSPAFIAGCAFVAMTNALVIMTSGLVLRTNAFVIMTSRLVLRTNALVIMTSGLVLRTNAFVIMTSGLVLRTNAFVITTSRLVLRTNAFVIMTSALVVLALAGCSTDSRREAASLIDLVGRYQAADKAHLSGAAAGVREFVCSDKDVCTAKEACLAYILPTTEAIQHMRQADQHVAEIEAKRDAGTFTERDLERIKEVQLSLAYDSDLLKKGHDARSRCEALVGALGSK